MSDKLATFLEGSGPWGLPRGWAWKPLGEVCSLNPPRAKKRRSNEAPTSFLPMTAVDEVTGSVKGFEQRPYREVSNGYKPFADNDVVFAKIDPAMQNGKSAVIKGTLDGLGFGSTEFIIMRPGSSVSSDWIHRFVRLRRFRRQAEKQFKGAIRHQRVPEEYMEKVLIPVPPDLVQQQTLLSRAEMALEEVRKARSLLQEMKEGYSRLLDVALSEVFADGVQKWEHREPLGRLVKVLTARAKPQEPEFRNLPHIGGDVIESGTGRLLPYRSAAEDNIKSTNYLFDGEAVLYSKLRPNLRKATVVGFRGLCSADIYPLQACDERLDLEFLMWALLSRQFTSYATNAARKRARMPKINQEELLAYELSFPVRAQQLRVGAYLRQVRANYIAAIEGLGQQVDAVEDIEQAVFESVFRGAL